MTVSLEKRKQRETLLSVCLCVFSDKKFDKLICARFTSRLGCIAWPAFKAKLYVEASKVKALFPQCAISLWTLRQGSNQREGQYH